jgi:hypothetical protein
MILTNCVVLFFFFSVSDFPDRFIRPKLPFRQRVRRISQELWKNFLGDSPRWFKFLIIFFLILNPIIYPISKEVAGWFVVIEFILTLTMALKCYPLQSGGMIAIEVVAIGMTSTRMFCSCALYCLFWGKLSGIWRHFALMGIISFAGHNSATLQLLQTRK